MSEVAAIGTSTQIAGFALAGVRIYFAETPEQARAAWIALPATVAVVILTAAAAGAVADEQAVPGSPLTVVIPT